MNKIEGCYYDKGRPFKQVASQKARPPIYNNSLAFLIFHRCEGDTVAMSGIAEFNNINIDGETYFTPEFSKYMETAIPVKIQQRGTTSNSPIKWGEPTGLNMQTYAYGSRNGYIVNAENPPLGAYSDLFLTNRSIKPQSTYLIPDVNANQYSLDDYIRAGDIFSVTTGNSSGKCLFSFIPYTTYYPQGNTCYKYDDNNGNLINEFYDNPDYQAFTNPCHCNPRLRRCLNHKEDFQIEQLVADGENDVEAGTQVILHNAIENDKTIKSIRQRRQNRYRKKARAPNTISIVFSVFIILLIIGVFYYMYSITKN